MIRVRFWFAACYILSILVVFGWWYSNVAVDLLNGYINLCTAIATALGEFIARVCGINPTLGSELLIEKINGGRILAIGFIALLWYLLSGTIWNFCRVRFRRLKQNWPILGVLICMFVVLIVLSILWLVMPETMKGVYEWHKQGLAGFMRTRGWHQAQLPLLEWFKLQNLIVYWEGVLIYVFFTQMVRLVLWLIAGFFWLISAIFTKIKNGWNKLFGNG